MIKKILPSSESKLKILNCIYENPGINITGLIKFTKCSPNLVVSYVNNLVKYGVLKERTLKGKIRPHIREIQFDLKSSTGKLILSLLEVEKRFTFLKKYSKFVSITNQLNDLFLDKNINFCLVYGSFARFSPDKDSDVDILVVGKLGEENRKRISEIFTTIDREYSIQIESIKDFFKNSKNNFHQNIIKDHIVLFGEFEFIEALSKIQ